MHLSSDPDQIGIDGVARLATESTRADSLRGRAPQDLNAVIAQRPAHTHARLVRGVILEGVGQREPANRDYDEALAHLRGERRAPGATAPAPGAAGGDGEEARRRHLFMLCLRRGALLSRRRQYAAAIRDLNEALALDPGCAVALLQRGNAFHLHGYAESACVDYGRCLALDPGDELARKNRALARMAQRRWAEALADLRLVPEGRRDARTWLAIVDCHRAARDVPAALAAAEQALAVASSAMSVHGLLGMSKLLTHCLVAKGDVEELAFPRARTTLRTLARAVHQQPGSHFARLKLALALFGRGNLSQAAGHVRFVAAEDPGNAMAAELAALLHGEAGNLHAACGRLDGLIAREPSAAARAQLRASRGVLHQRLDDLPLAERDLWLSARADPASSEAHYNLGCLHLQREDWHLARRALDRAVAARPTNDLALLNRSVALARLGRPELALADLDRALEISPDLGQAHLNRAVVRAGLGRAAEAEADLARAVQLLLVEGGGRDPGAREALFEARHALERGRGAAVDSLADYAAVLDCTPAEDEAAVARAAGGGRMKRSLWLDCFAGDVRL